jgi:predicted membrane channel-forming protein YqfA (hemolysin III family)
MNHGQRTLHLVRLITNLFNVIVNIKKHLFTESRVYANVLSWKYFPRHTFITIANLDTGSITTICAYVTPSWLMRSLYTIVLLIWLITTIPV